MEVTVRVKWHKGKNVEVQPLHVRQDYDENEFKETMELGEYKQQWHPARYRADVTHTCPHCSATEPFVITYHENRIWGVDVSKACISVVCDEGNHVRVPEKRFSVDY